MSHLTKSFAKAAKPEEIILFGNLDADIQELLRAAFAVRQRAYTPYSGFKVGAAFRGTTTGHDGNHPIIFTGCNVENAAFTPTSCAERTAITKAISEGCSQFTTGAVVAYEPHVFTSPCGVCRQFIREFANVDIPLYLAQALPERNIDEPFHHNDPVLCTSIFNLLPCSFHTYRT